MQILFSYKIISEESVWKIPLLNTYPHQSLNDWNENILVLLISYLNYCALSLLIKLSMRMKECFLSLVGENNFDEIQTWLSPYILHTKQSCKKYCFKGDIPQRCVFDKKLSNKFLFENMEFQLQFWSEKHLAWPDNWIKYNMCLAVGCLLKARYIQNASVCNAAVNAFWSSARIDAEKKRRNSRWDWDLPCSLLIFSMTQFTKLVIHLLIYRLIFIIALQQGTQWEARKILSIKPKNVI